MFVKIFALLENRLYNIKKEDYFIRIVVAWLLIFPAALPAQESLTLDKVWDLALHNNLSLKQQDQSIDQGRKRNLDPEYRIPAGPEFKFLLPVPIRTGPHRITLHGLCRHRSRSP